MDNNEQSPKKGTDRRGVLGSGLGMLSGVAAASFLRPSRAKAQRSRSAAATSNPNVFTVVGAGEMMVTRRFSISQDPAFLKIVDIMRRADLCYAHMEMNFAYPDELKWTPRGSAGVASYMIANPKIIEDLAWAGVDAVSLANNHSVDWGTEGVLATIKHFDEAGIAHAGTGLNMEVARQPAFFDVPKVRAAIVSAASGNNNYEWAGYPKAEIPGRPGMNPIRISTTYEVDKAAAAQLKAIGQKLGVLSNAAAARPRFNITPGTGVSGTGTAAFSFQESDKFDIVSAANPIDVAANMRSVDEAAKMANYVIFAHHNSTSEGSRSQDPSTFVIDVARKAIDAGADIYFGHGWHSFLGIEIYKGKPIIYGMGNFFYEELYMTRIPADSYESYGFKMDELSALNPASGNMHPGSGDESWGWCALYEIVYVNKRLSEIRLYPVDTGFDFTSGKGVVNRTQGSSKIIDGLPVIATGAQAQAILQRLKAVNARRGTKMDIRGEVGIITA